MPLVSILLNSPEEIIEIFISFPHKSAPLYSEYVIYIPAQRDIFVKKTRLLYMYEKSARLNEAEDHSIVFTLSDKKILQSVKAGVSDTLSRDGQMIPIQYNKRRSESDEKAVKSAFLVLITFLILRLLILIQEAHYSG